MAYIGIVVASLACMCHGWRVPDSANKFEEDLALADLLLATAPGSSSLGRRNIMSSAAAAAVFGLPLAATAGGKFSVVDSDAPNRVEGKLLRDARTGDPEKIKKFKTKKGKDLQDLQEKLRCRKYCQKLAAKLAKLKTAREEKPWPPALTAEGARIQGAFKGVKKYSDYF
mmetsp:Transcript_45023/g.70257  ORF Transcript_45023/g.70257 Transcript_45023/m.70257 type:complete len:170 (-) Transcript_45023:41-550(-)